MQSQRVSTLLGWLCELGDGDIDELGDHLQLRVHFVFLHEVRPSGDT